MLPLWLAQTEVQTTQKGQELGRMLYNELEQGDILSGVRVGLALLAYTDILLCSIWAMHRIRQTPEGLSIFYLPEYSPELNLIEILWRFMKYEWIEFWAYTSFAHLVQYVEEVIKNFGEKYKINFV